MHRLQGNIFETLGEFCTSSTENRRIWKCQQRISWSIENRKSKSQNWDAVKILCITVSTFCICYGPQHTPYAVVGCDKSFPQIFYRVHVSFWVPAFLHLIIFAHSWSTELKFYIPPDTEQVISEPISWHSTEKLKQTQQKQTCICSKTYYYIKLTQKTKARYGRLWPGNGKGLFWKD